jgi:sporulation protein YlmC with PRC-barrel domain
VLRVSLAALIAVAMPATAQIKRQATSQIERQATSQSEVGQTLIGLPVVAAGGETIGYITEVGVDDGNAFAVAYVVRASGIGGVPVTIPGKMLTHKGDHVELALTADQIRDLREHGDESGKIDAETAELAVDLVGAPVMHPDGTRIGDVADILFDEEGRPSRLRLRTGAMLGLGERVVELPQHAFMLLQGAVVVELSTDAIRALPDVSAGSSDEK